MATTNTCTKCELCGFRCCCCVGFCIVRVTFVLHVGYFLLLVFLLRLVHNKTTIPTEGLAMIRYHSCYPLHACNEYKDLLAAGDEQLLDWVREFNQFDLYTKADQRPDVDALWPYYQTLIDKYIPGTLKW